MNVQQMGEDNLIRRLKSLAPLRTDVVCGIGDDCAVVRTGRHDPYDLLLKSDPVIDGVHFGIEAAGAAIGHKALGRVLSDLAAMGGEAQWVLVDLVAPPEAEVARIEAIYKGMARLARRYGVAMVGGDTSRGQVLEVHVFAVGRVPQGTAVLRSGAHAGEAIYVTGSLGGSGSGRHLKFEPRLTEGQWLRASGMVTAMMDVSDGVATDLRRLAAASGVGAVLESDRIPVSAAARRMKTGRSALEHALADGEDFELLFTVKRGKEMRFETDWAKAFRLPCTRIGEMTPCRGKVELKEGPRCKVLKVRGYEHFSRHIQ